MIKSKRVSFTPTQEQKEELQKLSSVFNLSELLRQALTMVLDNVRGNNNVG